MADMADPDFLASLRALLPYPDDAPTSRETSSPYMWIFIVAVAFSSANVPEAVPEVFKYAVEEVSQVLRVRFGLPEDEIREHQLSIARKIREAVLQSGLLCGMPRVSTSLSL